nr:hypothetical protein [Tanacetum cinerariifolium]
MGIRTSEYLKEDQLNDKENVDKEGDVDDKGDDHNSDTKDTDDEDDETEPDEDEIYKYKICVCKDEDEEMLNVEAEDSGKGDAEVSDAAKAYAEKTKEAKDDSSLSISSGFGDQFLKLSSVQETSLVTSVTTLPHPCVSTTPHAPQQTTTPIPTPPITTDALTITTVIPESNALSVVQLRVAKLEKDVSKLKNVDHSAVTIPTLKS